jgi:F-type H+-transporting ATPase subunit b
LRNTISATSNLQFRSSRRLFWIALIAVLAVGIAVAPRRAIAQQAAPAATASQPSVTTAAKAPESSEDTADDEASNKFRHNPLVKSSAKVLHLSVETTARSFEFLNFAIIVLGIGIPLYKFLPRFLRNRAEKVRADIESARKVTEDANFRLSAVEAKLASLGNEIQKFRAEVEAESLQDEARIKAALAEESARIVASAEQEIGMAAAQATRGLRNFAADLAIDQASRQLKLTPETDRALIAEFVGNVEKGGLN